MKVRFHKQILQGLSKKRKKHVVHNYQVRAFQAAVGNFYWNMLAPSHMEEYWKVESDLHTQLLKPEVFNQGAFRILFLEKLQL